jgi:hypothetical protein
MWSSLLSKTAAAFTKDEVHTVLNIEIQKILAAEVGEQGVLVTEKTATLEDVSHIGRAGRVRVDPSAAKTAIFGGFDDGAEAPLQKDQGNSLPRAT